MKKRHLLACVWLGLLCGLSGRAAPKAPARSWEFVVGFSDLHAGVLDITMSLHGFNGDVRLCLFMEDSEPHLRDLTRKTPGPQVQRDGRCWRLPAVKPTETRLSYQYDLGALAAQRGQPDYAQRVDDTYLFNDQAVLLHPEPLPSSASFIEVEFHLPEGTPLVTPWTSVPASNRRLRFTPEQHDGGSYIGIGSLLRDLGTFSVGNTVGSLFLLNLPHQASDAALRTWIADSLGAVKSFYGDIINPRAVITLVPVQGINSPGVFGTVLRQGVPSSVIYFGAECSKLTLHDDWVAVHELFHVGNPIVTRKVPWFVEGFTTYYQDVLRARAGAVSAEDAWGDLHDGFRRFCQPEGGVSLGEESHQLYSTHHYVRVYWGGACLAFLTDAAIRERSHGQRSLDDVLLELRRKSVSTQLDEADVVAALDKEAGEQLVSKLLRERVVMPVADYYRRLGIEPTGPTSVRLNDAAPLSTLRKGIFQQHAAQ
jgi:hypothetical protein